MIGNAIKVMSIATGEEPEDYAHLPPNQRGKDPAAVAFGRKGGKARAERVSRSRSFATRSPGFLRFIGTMLARSRSVPDSFPIEAIAFADQVLNSLGSWMSPTSRSSSERRHDAVTLSFFVALKSESAVVLVPDANSGTHRK